MACSDCPQFIISPIASDVQQTLNRILEIQWVTSSFSPVLQRVLSSVNTALDKDLRTLISLIPDPPVIDLSAIVGMLLCPLTPVSLGLDPELVAAMDPQQVLVRLRRVLKAEADLVVRNYNAAVLALPTASVIKIMRDYMKELHRAMGDASDFAANYPVAVGLAAVVQAVCPDIYADTAWPFQALVEAVSNWSFDGVLPTGLPLDAQVAVTLVAQAEAKLLTWTTLAASVAV